MKTHSTTVSPTCARATHERARGARDARRVASRAPLGQRANCCARARREAAHVRAVREERGARATPRRRHLPREEAQKEREHERRVALVRVARRRQDEDRLQHHVHRRDRQRRAPEKVEQVAPEPAPRAPRARRRHRLRVDAVEEDGPRLEGALPVGGDDDAAHGGHEARQQDEPRLTRAPPRQATTPMSRRLPAAALPVARLAIPSGDAPATCACACPTS